MMADLPADIQGQIARVGRIACGDVPACTMAYRPSTALQSAPIAEPLAQHPALYSVVRTSWTLLAVWATLIC